MNTRTVNVTNENKQATSTPLCTPGDIVQIMSPSQSLAHSLAPSSLAIVCKVTTLYGDWVYHCYGFSGTGPLMQWVPESDVVKIIIKEERNNHE